MKMLRSARIWLHPRLKCYFSNCQICMQMNMHHKQSQNQHIDRVSKNATRFVWFNKYFGQVMSILSILCILSMLIFMRILRILSVFFLRKHSQAYLYYLHACSLLKIKFVSFTWFKNWNSITNFCPTLEINNWVYAESSREKGKKGSTQAAC